MAVSRRALREAVAAALATALPSAQAVYDYAVADFAQQTPVVRVLSRGSDRGLGFDQDLLLLVEFWVLFADEASGYTRRDAENVLDALEVELAEWVAANQRGSLWTAVDYDGASQVGETPLTVSGVAYLVEMVPLRFTVPR